MRIWWSGVFAILMTAIVSGVWAALLLANLAHAPAVPWSSGFFQGSLERSGVGAAAIFCTALLMAPIHALTQGFVWPTLLFYLLVDGMLGALAYLTKSIRPGVIVHAAGLFTFFGVIWPRDKERVPISQNGADVWFWIHLGQAVLFAILSLLALRRLARLAKQAADAATV